MGKYPLLMPDYGVLTDWLTDLGLADLVAASPSGWLWLPHLVVGCGCLI